MATVLVDIDDTLADTGSVLLEYVNAHARRQYRYEELNRALRESDEGEYHELVQAALRSGDDLRVPPLADALAGVRRLHEAGHEIHIVSARKENLHELTRGWLREHGFEPYVTQSHARLASQRGTEFKRDVARRINPAAAFDDTYNVVAALAPICPTVYLVDRPWNREDGLPNSVIRVPSFADGVERFLAGDRPGGPPAPRA